MFFACLAVVGQVNQVWWSKGRVLHVNPVAEIDSVTYGQFVNADTFLIVIDRASQRIVYDTVDVHVPGMVFHDTIHTTHMVYLNPGRRIGVFSVAKDRQVSFSQGNLQYVRNQDVWKFADQQYEYIGADNVKDGELANNIDLFGWSADNTTAPFGVSTSTNVADYSGDFVDWGVNEISGEAPNTWRTLSKDEWEYLINERPNAQQLRTKGSVNGNGGAILLPDDWVCPTECSVIMVPDEMNLLPDVNAYSLEEWRRMEDAGAVLLTAAGMRRNKDVAIVQHENIFGGYWASTIKSAQNSYCYNFHIQTCEYVNYSNWIYGCSVRLVHDTIVSPPAPCETFEVNGVKFNMMCVEGGTFMMGCTQEMDSDAYAHESPMHEVTLSDYYIGQIEVTQALWKNVMGNSNNPSTHKGNDLPVHNVSWDDCQLFFEKLNLMTGLNFRMPTEAEWEYAARGGVKSRGYKYAGSDNIDEVAWYKENADGKPHTFATKQPNELGIYDMSGNVFEWCYDWYGLYSVEAQVDPQGPESGPYRVFRGGGWKHVSSSRVAYRRTTGANLDQTSIGIRLVLDERPMPPSTPEYVDLGLSVKWATFNLGASAPEENGDYFACGETEPKAKYGWAQYKWGNGENKALTKYCNKAAYGVDGFTDNLTQLLPEDDAAHVNWGGNWRMPTAAEFDELINNCTIEKSTMNGVNGYLLTSKINGNSIFLPMAGYYNFDLASNKHQGNRTTCYYWSVDMMYRNTVYTNINAYNLNSGSTEDGGLIIGNNTRRCGFPIRPVYEAPKLSKQ